MQVVRPRPPARAAWAARLGAARGVDLARIEAVAEREEVDIVAVADTHLHNDYVSGALALARRHGADYLLHADEDVDLER